MESAMSRCSNQKIPSGWTGEVMFEFGVLTSTRSTEIQTSSNTKRDHPHATNLRQRRKDRKGGKVDDE